MKVIISQTKDEQGRRLITIDGESVGVVRMVEDELGPSGEYYWIATLNDGKQISEDRLAEIRDRISLYMSDKWGTGSWGKGSRLRIASGAKKSPSSL